MHDVMILGLRPELSRAIRKARHRQGFSLEAISGRIPFSRDALHRVERGKVQTIDWDFVQYLTEVLRAPELRVLAEAQIRERLTPDEVA